MDLMIKMYVLRLLDYSILKNAKEIWIRLIDFDREIVRIFN